MRPSGTARPLCLVIVLVVLGTLTAGCGGTSTQQADFTGRTVDPPFDVAAGTLTDTSGDPVALGSPDDDHRLRLVFFGYTHCPDICPTVLGSLALGLTKLSEADRAATQTYFVTTDPKRDTAARLRTYLERFDPSFEGLRGSLDDTAAIGRSLGIYVDEGDKLPGGGYDPNSHSTYVVAVDERGQAPAFWNAETSPSQFATDIEILLHGTSDRGSGTTRSDATSTTGWRAVDPIAVSIPAEDPVGSATAVRAPGADRPLIINIWASYCAPCKEELPLLESIDRAGLVGVVGLSRDVRERNAADSLDAAGVTYPNWMDTDATFTVHLDGRIPLASIPSSALVVDGKVVAVHVGVFTSKADVLAGLNLTQR